MKNIVNQLSKGSRLSLWILASALVLITDHLTKNAAVCLTNAGAGRTVAPFLNLVLVHNKGVAFGLLAKEIFFPRYLFSVIGVAFSFFMISLLTIHLRRNRLCAALSLVIGGTLGNVLDRVIHGYVIDFLDFHILGWHWPVFNVADSAICIGVLILFASKSDRT